MSIAFEGNNGGTTFTHGVQIGVALPMTGNAGAYGPDALAAFRAELETLRQDYIVTARAQGFSGFRVVTRYALRNAMIPTITIIGISFAILISGIVSLSSPLHAASCDETAFVIRVFHRQGGGRGLQRERLTAAGLPFVVTTFDGGHRIDRDTLVSLAAGPARGAGRAGGRRCQRWRHTR